MPDPGLMVTLGDSTLEEPPGVTPSQAFPPLASVETKATFLGKSLEVEQGFCLTHPEPGAAACGLPSFSSHETVRMTPQLAKQANTFRIKAA